MSVYFSVTNEIPNQTVPHFWEILVELILANLLWLLQCCKNRNIYYMIYNHVIKSFILIMYFIFILYVLLNIYYIFICTLYVFFKFVS